eukprot:152493_1
MLPRLARTIRNGKNTTFGRFAPKATAKFWAIPLALTVSASTMTVAMADCGTGSQSTCKGKGKGQCKGKGKCQFVMPEKDIRECQDLVFQWFWCWDTLVNTGPEKQSFYNGFIEKNFDEDWNLTVHGEGWVDTHKKDADYLECQEDMAQQFSSSYSQMSPLQFVSYKYCASSGSQFASFNGTALGNMGVRATHSIGDKNKMLQTHQRFQVTFIKRADSNKWKLYKEESTVSLLEFSDAVE